MAALTIGSDFGAPKIDSVTVSTISPSISHEVIGPDAMIWIFFHFHQEEISYNSLRVHHVPRWCKILIVGEAVHVWVSEYVGTPCTSSYFFVEIKFP